MSRTAIPRTSDPRPLAGQPVAPGAAKSERNAALDLTKGVLVVCMVIYHALNYTTEYTLAFRYFAFLPPSFIVITGFLLASIYPARHSIWDWRLHQRLTVRGAKLLLLFTTVNVLIQLTGIRSVHGSTMGLSMWWDYWFETYISGEGRTAAFEVLLPLAYLLLLAPLLLVLDRANWLVLPLLTAGLVGFLAWEACHGEYWFNAQLMSAGVLGILLGRAPLSALDRLARFWPALLLAYGGYFVAGRPAGQGYLLQLTGAVVALALIYSVCLLVDVHSFGGRAMERLGRYSLVAYIGQIGILQVLVRLLGRPEPCSIRFFLLLFGTLALTMFGVELIERARRHSALVNGTYKAVFA